MTNKQDVYGMVKDTFFTDLTINFHAFKDSMMHALPIFGELEVDIVPNEDGTKTVIFFDVDEAEFVLAPEGVSMGDVDTRMATRALTLHVDEHDAVTIVEHGFKIFTPANKEKVLLFASFIGKKINFN